jgi:hypothetical protein
MEVKIRRFDYSLGISAPGRRSPVVRISPLSYCRKCASVPVRNAVIRAWLPEDCLNFKFASNLRNQLTGNVTVCPKLVVSRESVEF